MIPCCRHYVQILKFIYTVLNPNLDVKMSITGVQTYLESIFSVPFVPNKNIMLWLALKTLKVWVEEGVFRTSQFKQTLFKVMSFTEIFLWIFNLEQKMIALSKHNNNNIRFFNCQKKIPCNLVPCSSEIIILLYLCPIIICYNLLLRPSIMKY